MLKKVFIPGLLGAVVIYLCKIVFNVVFRLNVRVIMKQVPNERAIYEVLKGNITEPGVYLCNPALTSEGRFPDMEPVYGILYSGIGHESAGLGELLGLLITIGAPVIVAWMLSVTSERFISSYGKRVLFFTTIGFLLAVFGDLSRFGIGGYPMSHALILSARTVITWTLAGLAVAWRMHPRFLVTTKP
jgi:hypothetical protein